jgi:hypothetical protein
MPERECKISSRLLSVFVLSLILFVGCKKENPVAPTPPQDGVDAALVVVVENNELLPPQLVSAYPLLKTMIDPKLAAIFGVPVDSLTPKNITEIISTYGQDWMIRRIVEASAKYSAIKVLTRASATLPEFLAALRTFKKEGRTIDVLFDLHANETIVLFRNATYPIQEITDSVRSQGIQIRALYQTCCYSSNHIPAWSGTGIYAVCGSLNTNSLTIFAPVVFLQLWTSGSSFRDAVTRASSQDIDSMKAYDANLGLSGFLVPTQTEIADSRMIIGGKNADITFRTSVLAKRSVFARLR